MKSRSSSIREKNGRETEKRFCAKVLFSVFLLLFNMVFK